MKKIVDRTNHEKNVRVRRRTHGETTYVQKRSTCLPDISRSSPLGMDNRPPQCHSHIILYCHRLDTDASTSKVCIKIKSQKRTRHNRISCVCFD